MTWCWRCRKSPGCSMRARRSCCRPWRSRDGRAPSTRWASRAGAGSMTCTSPRRAIWSWIPLPASGSPRIARSARWYAGPSIPGGLSMPMASTRCMRILPVQHDVVKEAQPAAPEARPRSVAHVSAAGRREGFGWRLYGLVYLAAFAVYAAVAWPHTHPPYMDSFYYLDIARNLAHGQGLTEGFVWNYLGGMPPLRHPSSEYWLPGISLLLAPALALGGGYRSAALLTAAVAALCPALAARIGY